MTYADIKTLKTLIKSDLNIHSGLEIEFFRTTEDGFYSQDIHPKDLGSALFHPHYTKDFAEPQIEVVSGIHQSTSSLMDEMHELMGYIKQKTPDILWPYSMPPLGKVSPSIIAKFADTEAGRRKHLYRMGLSHRYGIDMQLISGIHYNVSFSQSLIRQLYNGNRSPKYHHFQSELYLHIAREFFRFSPMMVYLMGASPISTRKNAQNSTYQNAVSLRMSPYGYSSSTQCSVDISYNSLSGYIKSLQHALSTPCKKYRRIKQQLNNHILQIENELYAPIRLKTTRKHNEPLDSMDHIKDRGIEYLEIRTFDLNPFANLLINPLDLDFTNLLLLSFLLKNEKKMPNRELVKIQKQRHHVALHGRDRSCMLEKNKPLLSEIETRLKEMKPLAEATGLADALNHQLKKLRLQESYSEKTYSLLQKNPVETIKTLAKSHPVNSVQNNEKNQLMSMATQSLIKEQRAVRNEVMLAKGYETLELSTQILIKGAIKHGIHVEVLDPHTSLIRLTQQKHREMIQQATKTSKDSYITPLLMENKHISKKLLIEKNISAPLGAHVHTKEKALQLYAEYQHLNLVIKPNTTNFGTSIHFVAPGDEEGYRLAICECFKHDTSVIIEEKISGQEYRFLVIDHKLIGIVKREPAHVIGDGILSISGLINQKNENPSLLRLAKDSIPIDSTTIATLAKQNLMLSDIPEVGLKVFLRYNSNVSSGGEAVECGNDIDTSYKTIALKATKAMDAKICGVDMIIHNTKRKATRSNYSIIEVNFNPSLYIHRFPSKGRAIDASSSILKLLGFALNKKGQ